MAVTKPLKVVSEAARERETFRYDPALFAGFTFNRDGNLPSNHDLKTASDCILMGLAQLGAYQTGTERAFVSFFDMTYQYIVAEATPSMRIVPNIPSDDCPEPLGLCGSAIPRDQGTCDHVLYLEPSPDSTDPTELPLSFVPNLANDSRFSSRPYCQFGPAGQFYAAVPIRTSRGINIGAFCVMSTTQPKSWDENSTQRLRDISFAITKHIELRRAKHEARNHVRVNRGLGSFIAGKGTLTGWQAAANAEAFADDATLEGALDSKQQHSENREEQQRRHSMHILSDGESDSPTTSQPNGSKKPQTDAGKPSTANEDSSGLIFSKAANIIREAFEVEGSVFLDVAIGSYRKSLASPAQEIPNLDEAVNQASVSSSSDEQAQPPPGAVLGDAQCDILGFSTTEASSINGPAVLDENVGVIPKRFLAKLLRRYPNGKIFSYDAIGELQTSDSSGDDDVSAAHLNGVDPVQPTADGTRPSLDSTRRKTSGQNYNRSQEGALIHSAFPCARSVAFIPVWDPKRERWFAGGFIYTLKPTRIFSADSELSFLGAFAKLIAAEVLNLETLQADQAKSDVLGSLSHELRSPLHGLILSTGLLNDTDLSVFQGNAVHTIETCGRTLLDTIDHLLDYSRINSFAAKETPSTAKNYRGHLRRSKTDLFGKKSLFRHTRLDALVEDVVESVFAGFNFQHMSIRQLSNEGKSGHADTMAHNRLDVELAMEQLGPSFNDKQGKPIAFNNTSVYITIDPNCDWMFYIQPGAIRRIIMNLLGNSLKYTPGGVIRVSLSQQPVKRSPGERLVTLSVQDTGKGMSVEYLRHKLFKPFSQEDELMPGTGLGLSLVKKITSQLQGQISVDSQLGVGTTITLNLPLELTARSKNVDGHVDDDAEFKDRVRQLANLRVRLQGFGSEWSRDGRALVEDICRRWLHMDLVSDQDKSPDVMLWSEDALPSSLGDVSQLAKLPNVVVCRDALAAYQILTRHESLGQDRVFEYISQPLGPRALARSLLLAFERWAGLPKIPTPSRPPGLKRAHSSHAEKRSRLSDRPGACNGGLPLQQKPESQIPGGEGPEDSTSRKFLLVDDNYVNLKVLSAYMKKLNQAYEAVVNGQEAVEAYAANPGKFAGILMDISMPVMDGLEATRQIRAHERRVQAQPVIIFALTGLASGRIHQEALESGVNVFLTKPVTLNFLEEKLGAAGLFAVEKNGGDA